MDRAGLEVLELPELGALGVDAFVTTRHGGVSAPPYDTLNLGLHVGDENAAVIENRRRLAAAAHRSLDELVFMDQVHGARVAIATADDAGRGAYVVDHALSATDAVVTTSDQIALVVLVADCSPILLVDPVARVLGLAHAGWRGTAAGIGPATVEIMEGLGAERSRIHVLIGPTVDAERYEVGDEVVDSLRRAGGSDVDPAIRSEGSRAHVDIAEANARLLASCGVPSSSITVTGTRTDDTRLFSDRTARPCGRFGLIAQLASPGRAANPGAVASEGP